MNVYHYHVQVSEGNGQRAYIVREFDLAVQEAQFENTRSGRVAKAEACMDTRCLDSSPFRP